jgi:hypothetical protein
VRAESLHLTVSQSMEALAKSLLFVSERVQGGQQQLRAGVLAAVQGELLGPLQAELGAALGGVQAELARLAGAGQEQAGALERRLQAGEEAAAASLSAVLGEVAAATSSTLAAISKEALGNLTRLEQAVFVQLRDLNSSSGRALAGAEQRLQGGLARQAEEAAGAWEQLFARTLPALHASLANETRAWVLDSLARWRGACVCVACVSLSLAASH